MDKRPESNHTTIESLLGQIDSKRPPIHQWNPPLSGDIDIVIDADGNWYHEGDTFQRMEIVTLFASILKKEGDDYYLVTPVEKWRITVKDLPFMATIVKRAQIQQEGTSIPALAFTTSLDDTVVAGASNPIEVHYQEGSDQPDPKILIRDNLYAKIHRNVFYELASFATETTVNNKTALTVSSNGEDFILGYV